MTSFIKLLCWHQPRIENKDDLVSALKDGKILIRLANKIQPSLKLQAQKMNMPFSHRENILAFLKGLRQIGVPDADSFETNDLYEGKNLAQVCVGLESLGRVAQKIDGYNGPVFGVKLAEKFTRSNPEKREDGGGLGLMDQAISDLAKEKRKVDESYRKGKPGPTPK